MDEFQHRLIAPCTDFDPNTNEATPDTAALFRRLLLFETYVLQSIRFREFVPLVHTLGVENVVRLLNSGAIMLEMDPAQILGSGRSKTPALPLNSFSFSLIRAAHPNEYAVQNLQDLRRELYGYISQVDLMKLESALLRALIPIPKDSGFTALRGLEADLRSNSPVVKAALRIVLQRDYGIELEEADLDVRIAPEKDDEYRATSNLERFGLIPEEAHKTIEFSILAVGGVNRRIEDMKNYNAMSGFIDGELPLFAGKFDFLADTLSPGLREKTFDRVVRVQELPSLDLTSPDRSFDVERFLEIRASKECAEFRAWLRGMKSETDEDIREHMNAVRAKLSPFVHGAGGKGVRILISTAVGMIPLVGTAIGAVLSIIDAYLLERVFPISGPTLFLSRQYRSLFEKTGRHRSRE